MRGPKRSIAETKKGLFYFGISLATIGLVSLVSTFFSDGGIMDGLSNLDTSFLIRAGAGLSFVLLGWFLIRYGRSATAPRAAQNASQELAASGEYAGGVVEKPQSAAETGPSEQPLRRMEMEAKLRRLEKLLDDGVLTEEEYLEKRDELIHEEE